MRKLTVFNSVTTDGYFAGEKGDLSWAHAGSDDPEWKQFVIQNAKGGGVMVFGRKTYDLMNSYWPTNEAIKSDPEVAERMNNLPKVVFSRSMNQASWNNTQVVKGDPVQELTRMKQEDGPDMVLMGSGNIIAQVAPAGLIDEFQFVMTPVVLGKGRTMFEGIGEKLSLKLVRSRAFGNGNVLLCYQA